MVYIHIADKIRKREMDKLQNAFSSYTLETTKTGLSAPNVPKETKPALISN
ncbi:hypothetical protein D3C71_2160440 [compost metagenome]